MATVKKKRGTVVSTTSISRCTFVTVNMGRDITRSSLLGEPTYIAEDGSLEVKVPYGEEMIKTLKQLNPSWSFSEPFVELPDTGGADSGDAA